MENQKAVSASDRNTPGFAGSKNIPWKQASRSCCSQTLVHDITILLKTHAHTQTKAPLCFAESICVSVAKNEPFQK